MSLFRSISRVVKKAAPLLKIAAPMLVGLPPGSLNLLDAAAPMLSQGMGIPEEATQSFAGASTDWSSMYQNLGSPFGGVSTEFTQGLNPLLTVMRSQRRSGGPTTPLLSNPFDDNTLDGQIELGNFSDESEDEEEGDEGDEEEY